MEENQRSDCELPNKMASLDLWDPSQAKASQSNENIDSPIKRSLRKRAQPIKITTVATNNRRVILKPRRIQPNVLSEEDLKKIYCNSKIKSVSQSLETIFEEPRAVNDTVLLIGGKKIKRSLKFNESSIHTKEKIKKRRSKIKRLLGNKNIANRKKVTMQAFLKTLENLDADEAIDESKND